jgi:hypothetical protein
LGKHEEMVRVIYNIIKDLVPFISQEYIDGFYDKIKTVSPKSFDDKFLLFLKQFTMKALENYYDLKVSEFSTSESHPIDYAEVCEKKEKYFLS